MASKTHYLSEAKMIVRIADEEKLVADIFLAELYVQIASVEELKRIADILATSISPSLARAAGLVPAEVERKGCWCTDVDEIGPGHNVYCPRYAAAF